eukprot:scaffold467263_cov23-Prasinocladus_malaysianus.AAC.1
MFQISNDIDDQSPSNRNRTTKAGCPARRSWLAICVRPIGLAWMGALYDQLRDCERVYLYVYQARLSDQIPKCVAATY